MERNIKQEFDNLMAVLMEKGTINSIEVEKVYN